MTKKKPSVGILGAGITGLSIAYVLDKQGFDVSVYEKEDCVGGVIQSHRSGGWLMERGPNTLMVRCKEVWNLLKELNLDEEILEADEKSVRRYILKDGQLMPLPSSLVEFLKTGLLSGRAKFRLLKEPFIASAKESEESIADFITRRLGKEVLDYAVNPFVAGIFAGDPEKLSLKHTFSKLHELEQEYGSLLKGMLRQKKNNSSRKALISFKNGLQTLPIAIGNQLKDSIKLNHKVERIRFLDKEWHLNFKNGTVVRHNAIVATIPVHALTSLMTESDAREMVSNLGNIFYAPMSVIHLGFRKDQVEHSLDGFGMLIPEAEQGKLLGTLFSSTLFPERAPDGHALLTSFIGGARNPEMAQLPKKELFEIARSELGRLLGITGQPGFASHTCWEKAIPQYEIGYDQHLQKMEELENRFPGLYLAGSFRGGVSVPDCITHGLEKVRKIASNLIR